MTELPRGQSQCSDPSSATKLWDACAEDKGDEVRALLEGGFDPTIVARGGVTPLNAAVAFGAKEATNVLLNHRPPIPVDTPDDFSRTALWWACNYGQGDTVAALLARGADPTKADKHDATPVLVAMIACIAYQRFGALEELVNHRPAIPGDVWARGMFPLYPLHPWSSLEPVFKVLASRVSSSAEAEIVVLAAAAGGCSGTVAYLTKNHPSIKRDAALEVARFYKRQHVVKTLLTEVAASDSPTLCDV